MLLNGLEFCERKKDAKSLIRKFCIVRNLLNMLTIFFRNIFSKVYKVSKFGNKEIVQLREFKSKSKKHLKMGERFSKTSLKIFLNKCK